MTACVAIDLGAASGRVVLGSLQRGGLDVAEVHRFANVPLRASTGLHWDVHALFGEILTGLRRAVRLRRDIVSIGVDTWGVDYALLDDAGQLVTLPFHYRDESRHRVAAVHARVPPRELYDRTGLQFLPFTTIFQLAADSGSGILGDARALLMLPDLFSYWLCGVMASETTMASTSGLLDVATGSWALDIAATLGYPTTIFQPLRRPGELLGQVRPELAAETGLRPDTQVAVVGSHDTASAVVAAPMTTPERSAYISCGTWSLVGTERSDPLLTDASFAANFSNERGVGGRTRLLRNVMGLWPLQEALRDWRLSGEEPLADLLDAAAALPSGPIIDVDDPSLLAPGDMAGRVKRLCATTGRRVPATEPELVRCIVESLAAGHASTLDELDAVSGTHADQVHIVGGGARNALLAQLTADLAGRSVVTGPAEATAVGNLLVQAGAMGLIDTELTTMRHIVARGAGLRRFEPGGGR